MMSFWTFSDVFEEGGPIAHPFSGQFGLRAEYGIDKPSFYDFALLHELGTRRLANTSQDVLVTKAEDGSLIVAAWSIVDPAPDGQPDSTLHAPDRKVTLEFRGVSAGETVSVQRVDNEHGNVLPVYAAMGKPQYPTPEQVEEMNRRAALPAPETLALHGGRLQLTLEPNALVLVRIASH